MSDSPANNFERHVRLMEAAAILLDSTEEKTLGTIALNKAVFYLDLVHLRDKGTTFTDNAFVAIDMGPVLSKYPRRLIGRLQDEGIAIQRQVGDAKPISLVSTPDYRTIDPEVAEMARNVATWCSQKTADELSDFSHLNPGWMIANAERERRGTGQGVRINMIIAMQQIVEDDPWILAPATPQELARYRSADTAAGIEW